MIIDIRRSIISNFKGANPDEFQNSINASIENKDEITLPGLGVFFEILWNNSDENSKEYILNTLKNGIEKYK